MGVFLSSTPLFRISAINCDRPLSVPFACPLCIGMNAGGGGGGGNGGDTTAAAAAANADDSFGTVSILRHQITFNLNTNSLIAPLFQTILMTKNKNGFFERDDQILNSMKGFNDPLRKSGSRLTFFSCLG